MSSAVDQPGPGSTGVLSDPPHRDTGRASGSDMARELANPLGTYLRVRRDLVTPEQAGLLVTGNRRVPGLRREELAMIAGISADYYLRLERGKDRTPSPHVLEALARALQLDHDHFEHLKALASEPSRVATSSPQHEIPQTARELIDALGHPAFIEDAYFDVLAANEAALELNPRLQPGRNQIRDLYVDKDEQALHPDWDGVAACLTASLRHAMGNATDDPRFHQLTGELSRSSIRFQQIWARHDVRAQRGAVVRLKHPRLGEQTFNREQLQLNGTDRLSLVIYYPRTPGEGTVTPSMNA